MKESERILFTDFLASMNKKFIESGWITVSAECLHSALVSDEKLSDALSQYEWDLRRGSNGVSEIWSDGVLYDSWQSQNETVLYYWEKERSN